MIASARIRTIRSDGWTAERQLSFLNALASTRSIVQAAAHAGMSRESAYRLRDRREGALFGLLWDRILSPAPRQSEVHIAELSDGAIIRLLERHFLRETGDLTSPGSTGGRGDDRRCAALVTLSA